MLFFEEGFFVGLQAILGCERFSPEAILTWGFVQKIFYIEAQALLKNSQRTKKVP